MLQRNDCFVDINPSEEYKEVTIRLWGRGVVLRRLAVGSEIAAERRFRVAANQFILSRIDARNGAVGIVPDDLDGAVVSSDFPSYNADHKQVLPAFLGWLSKTRGFVDRCRSASEGTTNRVRLQETKFLAIEIPLPPLSEQRRIVAKMERLAAKIDEVHVLSSRSCAKANALLQGASRNALVNLNGVQRVPLQEVCAEIIDCLHSNPIYSDVGIPTLRSPDIGWGKLRLADAKKTSQAEYERRTKRGEPREGDIILVREGGGTGKAGMVEAGQKVSLGQRVMQLRPDLAKVVPRFLLFQWLSPLIQDNQIAERMKGSASPHLNIGALRKFDFILPSHPEQRRIVAYLDGLQAKVDQARRLQAETAAELDALLPALLDRAFKGQL